VSDDLESAAKVRKDAAVVCRGRGAARVRERCGRPTIAVLGARQAAAIAERARVEDAKMRRYPTTLEECGVRRLRCAGKVREECGSVRYMAVSDDL
jgi:hypothetical protein